jgi:hypothetical protein
MSVPPAWGLNMGLNAPCKKINLLRNVTNLGPGGIFRIKDLS